jgi:chemotaxis protein MotB
LKDGIDGQDVKIKVDKPGVFVNISNKMLFTSGSSDITPRAIEVLGKIAQIVSSRPVIEVMVEVIRIANRSTFLGCKTTGI